MCVIHQIPLSWARGILQTNRMWCRIKNMRDFAIDLARRAGALLRAGYEQAHTIEYKSSVIDLVTEVDRASEALLVNTIRQQFPEHAILSEEGHGNHGPALYAWIIDPLDGTVNYAHGFPFFSVTLAVSRDGLPCLGVTYDPLRDELFVAERGTGATLNGRPLHVSKTSRVQDALLATGFSYARAIIKDNNLAEFNRLMPRTRGVRRAGAASLDMAYVAAGRLDGYWEMYLAPWDWAAGALLVEEAGGVVTGFDGKPWQPGRDRIVASNGHIHAELLRELAEARRGP